MRTKALLCAAALAVGITAQAQVYSLNVVGYYNVTVPANSYALIANQLNTTNNTLNALLPSPPDFTEVYKFVGGAWVGYLYDAGWSPDGDATINPGEGVFFNNVTASPLTLTFVGEVMQGALQNGIPAGYSIRSSMVPQAGGVSTVLGLAPADFDELYTYSGAWVSYLNDSGWAPSEPSLGVGEAFFYNNNSVSNNWVRNFTVQ